MNFIIWDFFLENATENVKERVPIFPIVSHAIVELLTQNTKYFDNKHIVIQCQYTNII